jgi:hypothetical protein
MGPTTTSIQPILPLTMSTFTPSIFSDTRAVGGHDVLCLYTDEPAAAASRYIFSL